MMEWSNMIKVLKDFSFFVKKFISAERQSSKAAALSGYKQTQPAKNTKLCMMQEQSSVREI